MSKYTNYGLRSDVVVSLDSSGAGMSRIVNNNAATLWIIRQASVITSPTKSGCTCTVRPPTGIVDTSYFAGTGDTAHGQYYLHSSEYLELTWSNGPANGSGICTYYYDEVIL